MPHTITDQYFGWLYATVAGEISYVRLSSYLHNRWEFTWSVDFDENRSADGYELRESFLYETNQAFTENEVKALLNEPVSVFEVLVALCKRIDFDIGGLVDESRMDRWYAELLSNLNLDGLNDDSFVDNETNRRKVDRIIGIMLDRTYAPDGAGSLFPLSYKPSFDMRETELWYQMMAYLEDQHPLEP